MTTVACNNKDTIQRNWKGYRLGRSHHNAKLTEEAVRDIRHRHEVLHEGYIKLSKATKLSWSTIRDVCIYRTWRHVH